MLLLCLTYIDDENDKNLFEHIYKSYRKQMIFLALSIVNNRDDAEDVVEDVFLRIAQKNWESVRKIENQMDLRNYLLKAAKNGSLNKLKTQVHDAHITNQLKENALDNVIDISEDEFINMICVRFEYQELVQAIEQLHVRYRDVIYFHYVIGFTIKETAGFLNQKVVTTKQQLVRGKKLLLELLERGVKKNGNE